MFDIVLQRNNSDKNHLDKSITDIATVTGVLRDPTSIIDPVVIIECDLSQFTRCNYMTIPTFGRSYFINNIKSLKNGIVEFTCHVDVLSSFKSEIRQNSAIIKRQQHSWNLYVNDGTFKIYQNPDIITKAFPSGFTTQEFDLAVAGS